MDTVNGIPTSVGFQVALGRIGFSARLKKPDVLLQSIFQELIGAESYRALRRESALRPLRRVRRACVEWLKANDGKRRWERTRIKDLWQAVHARVTVVIETVFDPKFSPTKREYERTKSFNKLTDDILSGHNARTAFKTVGENYDIERFTPRHIPGSATELAKLRWAAAGTRLTFEDWIVQVLIPQSEEDPIGRFYFGQTTQTADLLKAGVKYCSPRERRDFIIESWGKGELLNAAFEPFHTGAMKSPVSGPGWAIFVVDLQENLYAGPYAFGAFHHSSFLAGAPVRSAGEIAVNQGRVIGVTNKTGHYKAGPPELRFILELLRADEVQLRDVAVNDPFRAPQKWFRGTEALKANGDLAALGEGTIPKPTPVPP